MKVRGASPPTGKLVWLTQSEVVTKYGPNMNGHTEAGPLGKDHLTSDPIGHHTEENAN